MLKKKIKKNIFFQKLKYGNLNLILKKYHEYFFKEINKKI